MWNGLPRHSRRAWLLAFLCLIAACSPADYKGLFVGVSNQSTHDLTNVVFDLSGTRVQFGDIEGSTGAENFAGAYRFVLQEFNPAMGGSNVTLAFRTEDGEHRFEHESQFEPHWNGRLLAVVSDNGVEWKGGFSE